MNFDIREVPFSRYGSYMAFSHLPEDGSRAEGVYLRSVRGPLLCSNMLQETFRLELWDGQRAIPCRAIASPALLRLEAPQGQVEICMPEPDIVRIRAQGVGVRLTMETGSYDFALPRGRGRWQIVKSGQWEAKTMLSPLAGRLIVKAPWRDLRAEYVTGIMLPDEDSQAGEWVLEEFTRSYQEREHQASFDECVQQIEETFHRWLSRMPVVPDEYAEARELAAYINWSCVVEPHGLLPRPAMYMSKNWMAGLWSWDHCFNAMALAYAYPELAWDQLMIVFDLQDASGALPDFVNDQFASWSFCKPPVHGWALSWMMARSDTISSEKLEEIYEPLCRWTRWWFAHRDDDGDGVPQYNHGNDSGWDNSTVFAAQPPVESPDLSAFLVIQMETLAIVAEKLNRQEEAEHWKDEAAALLVRMLEHFWQGDRFVAVRAENHEVIEQARDSLLLYMPLILGKRLPAQIRRRLVAGLVAEGRFLTAHGLATESLDSPFYRTDGYWRGSIWAAPTLLLFDGLRSVGETALAWELARRFCAMVRENGLAENYDAITGAGQRDPAFTWTSSVFLILAHELETRGDDG